MKRFCQTVKFMACDTAWVIWHRYLKNDEEA
jgi:hypothetical protein